MKGHIKERFSDEESKGLYEEAQANIKASEPASSSASSDGLLAGDGEASKVC
jgi:hypothetical protein